MSDSIIKVENLGKKYKIRHQQLERYVALRDVIAGGVKGLGNSALSVGRRLFGLNATSNGRPKPTGSAYSPMLD